MTENHTTEQKRLSLIMKMSYLFCTLAIAFCPFLLIIYRPNFKVVQGHQYSWLPAAIGLILCLYAIIRFRKHVGKKTMTRAVICVIVALMLITASRRPYKIGFATMMVCGSRMGTLGKALITYAQENGDSYPDANSWCDELIKAGEVEPKTFLCMPDYELSFMAIDIFSYPEPGNGKCHYAMNTNCRPDSSPDTVLLFETTLGWNKHGGPELVTLDNHRGMGFNVVFNNGRTINKRDPFELNWGE